MSNGPSLVKQLTGALVGGALGLVAYYGYEAAAPHLTAWTSIPQQWLESNGEGSAVADKGQAQDRTGAHFESRAKEISEKFGAAYKKYQVTEEQSSSAAEESSAESVSSMASAWSEASSVASVPAPSWIDGAASSWDDSAMEKAPGPDTDELPDSGIGALGAVIAAGMGAGGLRMRKKRK
jgi:hypothetical protein